MLCIKYGGDLSHVQSSSYTFTVSHMWSNDACDSFTGYSLYNISTSPSWLHANSSIQSDDFSINHGILSQWCHQVGKLSGVSQAWGEGHLAGKKWAHLLRKTSEEGSGEETWREKHNTDLEAEENVPFRSVFKGHPPWKSEKYLDHVLKQKDQHTPRNETVMLTVSGLKQLGAGFYSIHNVEHYITLLWVLD